MTRSNPPGGSPETTKDIAALKAKIDAAEGITDKAEEESTMAAMEKGQSMAFRVIVEFTVPIVAGAWLGNWLDGQFSTKPLLVIMMALLGFGVGLKNILRLSKQDEEQQARNLARSEAEKEALLSTQNTDKKQNNQSS